MVTLQVGLMATLRRVSDAYNVTFLIGGDAEYITYQIGGKPDNVTLHIGGDAENVTIHIRYMKLLRPINFQMRITSQVMNIIQILFDFSNVCI